MEDINNLRQSFSYRLDLRGKRADEALSALSKYIDTARLLGESELSVLHGKGDGVLKTVLRDYLKQCPDVESYKAERVEFGGEGITKIKLK
jgi:DNA mismatch repair protein MutS2